MRLCRLRSQCVRWSLKGSARCHFLSINWKSSGRNSLGSSLSFDDFLHSRMRYQIQNYWKAFPWIYISQVFLTTLLYSYNFQSNCLKYCRNSNFPEGLPVQICLSLHQSYLLLLCLGFHPKNLLSTSKNHSIKMYQCHWPSNSSKRSLGMNVLQGYTHFLNSVSISLTLQQLKYFSH